MDFSRLGSTNSTNAPIDPIKIFEALPSLEDTPNDLWRGQDQALTGWHEDRDKSDVLILLNTGAGKTIVGLLVAQSLINEGIENVVYVCSTIDLVIQTSREADRIGLAHTTRVKGSYSNHLFETGKSFCITTYAALFGGLSSIQRYHFPGAVIFDDAHVAEKLLRDAFTLRIDRRELPNLFKDIVDLFDPHFRELGVHSRFSDSVNLDQQSTSFVAPAGLYERSMQLLSIFNKHDARNSEVLKYSFAWLKDNFDACAAIFTRGVFELAPPFLPSLALDIFEQNLRRIYLSATLESQTEFIRAFGRKPKAVVRPSNDAGNGERLILDGREIRNGFGPDFMAKLVARRKGVIAVPDYGRAKHWTTLAEPPKPENFSRELEAFRKKGTGAFTLVSRVDGIDLPHETCRIMCIDGLPSGTSLLERYQWEFLRMKNVHAVRIANRLAQLFGRINRGRNDYGAFLLEGDDISKWMDNDRNLALLPPLLQKQVHVSRQIHESGQVKTQKDVVDLIDSVLGRDQGWLDYYQREVRLGELDKDQLARAESAEPFLVEAALSEARYAAAMWSRDPTLARRTFEATVDQTATHDTPLGGWHALWLGAAYEREGDREAALREYGIAMKRLGRAMTLPRGSVHLNKDEDAVALSQFGKAVWDLVNYPAGAKFESEVAKRKKETALIDIGTTNQAEAGVRVLGELLGFTSTRPDNDEGKGPDVLWRDEAQMYMIGFELKTDKGADSNYSKKEIGQGHNHLEWMDQTYSEYTSLGLLYLGPDATASSAATPSEKMGLCLTSTIIGLRDQVFSLVEDFRKKTPMERLLAVEQETRREYWSIQAVVSRLKDKKIMPDI